MPDQQNILRHNFTSPQLIASLGHWNQGHLRRWKTKMRKSILTDLLLQSLLYAMKKAKNMVRQADRKTDHQERLKGQLTKIYR